MSPSPCQELCLPLLERCNIHVLTAVPRNLHPGERASAVFALAQIGSRRIFRYVWGKHAREATSLFFADVPASNFRGGNLGSIGSSAPHMGSRARNDCLGSGELSNSCAVVHLADERDQRRAGKRRRANCGRHPALNDAGRGIGRIAPRPYLGRSNVPRWDGSSCSCFVGCWRWQATEVAECG